MEPFDDSSGTPRRSPFWSLERRLPVLISLLLVGVVGGLGLAAYREVRATAVSRASERLERAGREFFAGASRSTDARTEAVRALAADDVIVRATTSRADPAAVAARLRALRQPADSTVVAWRLSSLAGEERAASPGGWSSADSAALASIVAAVAQTASAQRSPFHAFGDRVHTWAAAPVMVDGRVVGVFALLLRLGDNSGVEATLHSLLDDDARMLFTSRGDGQWVTPRGRPVAAPFVLPDVDGRAVRVRTASGVAYAAQYALPGTPWVIVLYQPEASVLRRPHEFLKRLLAAGAIVLGVATLGAWLLARHVSRPLRDVTEAAAALRRGEYARRVRVRGGGHEVAALAATFNAMAAAIEEAHASLADRNRELQHANAAKSQFLAMMSHELRTPLNAIGGFAELMALGLRGPITPEQRDDLGRIQRNKDLLLAIITDILEFSRADAGVIALRLERVAVAPLLTDVAEMLSPQFAAREIRCTIADVSELAIVMADRERVKQVVLNLLSNALKFTEPGGEVAIAAAVDGETVRIDVRDTGPGIASEHLASIFEPFVQLDASLTRRAGGTGLGLAIARQLTAAMGGTLSVRSTAGAGSTFSLALQRAEAAGEAQPTSTDTPRSVGQVA